MSTGFGAAGIGALQRTSVKSFLLFSIFMRSPSTNPVSTNYLGNGFISLSFRPAFDDFSPGQSAF